jgi:hypothetical protein
MRLQRHTELDVYKKAFDVAMQVFTISKSFPKEEPIRSPIRFAGRRGRFALISQKRGASGDMKQHSFLSCPTQKVRRLKLKYGFNSQSNADTSPEMPLYHFIRHMMKFCV